MEKDKKPLFCLEDLNKDWLNPGLPFVDELKQSKKQGFIKRILAYISKQFKKWR